MVRQVRHGALDHNVQQACCLATIGRTPKGHEQEAKMCPLPSPKAYIHFYRKKISLSRTLSLHMVLKQFQLLSETSSLYPTGYFFCFV